jgi:UDP-glucose 4-epimerase
MDKSKYVLVTGGAGYIGSHTVVALIESGYVPIIVDDFRNAKKSVISRLEELTGSKILVFDFAVHDKEKLTELFKKFSFSGVIHFAADKAVGESVLNPLKYFNNNITGLIVLLEVMTKFGNQRLVFSSSCTVYGTPDQVPVTENTPTKMPESPYGYTKLINEQMIAQVQQAHPDLSVALLRYFNPIGAHPSGLIGEEPQGIPNNLLPYITQTAAGIREFLTIYGDDYATSDGSCVRDYIHVVDLAAAHVAAIEYLDTHTGVLETVNLGTGKGTSVLEMVNYFQAMSGQTLKYKVGARRPGDVPEIYANAEKAEAVLGWSSKLTVKDAIRDAWNYEQKSKKV